MATNDFKPFAVGGGANVITQDAYAANSALLAGGFSAGTAESNQLNKVWRQSSIMSAVLAQFIADNSGENAVDDGTTATLLTNLEAGVNALIATAIGGGGSSSGLGVGQTWHDETSNRAMKTTYTNTSGAPMMVAVYTGTGGADSAAVLEVDGVDVAWVQGDSTNGIGASSVYAVVPDGSTYYCNTGTGISAFERVLAYWAELY